LQEVKIFNGQNSKPNGVLASHMNVLIIGGGGREHALAWKTAQAESIKTVYVAPGNAGTELEAKCQNIAIDVMDIDGLIRVAKEHEVELTIIGPEAPLVAGIVDAFSAENLKCFGPSAGAAQLEGSKAFTKDFLAKYQIPTADYAVFSDSEEACEYIEQQGAPIVVKADGLAAGKGVIVAHSVAQAKTAARDMLIENKFGDAGARVVIEEFLAGEEASFICMVDGANILPMATSQDHKARDDGDLGPNTGGMGAYSPAPVVDENTYKRIMREVIQPTVKGMQNEGFPYVGFLYAGLMITPDGVAKVIEYNCRFGDPETQPIMMRLKSDLAQLCLDALDGKLAASQAEWDPRAALGVVLAAGGYPDSYAKGVAIAGLDHCDTDSCKTFHAGTSTNGDEIVTSGGRVLCVTALGESVTQAQQAAYQSVDKINWDNMYFRSDIGYRALAREKS